MAVSDRIAVMSKGDIQQVGTPKDIYQRPANLFVATFIGRSNVLDGELRMETASPCCTSMPVLRSRWTMCVPRSAKPARQDLGAPRGVHSGRLHRRHRPEGHRGQQRVPGSEYPLLAHTDDGDKIEIIQESQIDSIIRMARSSVSASRPRRSTCLTRKASRTCWKVSATTTPFNGQEAVP